MAAEHCPECLLTPQAEELLERLEDKLRRTRPGDASWKTTICPRCGRLSGIFDEREGWSVGEAKDRGWTSGPRPVAETKPVLRRERIVEEPSMGPPKVEEVPPTTASRRIDLDSLPTPTWVTVREAAFLAHVSETQVLVGIGHPREVRDLSGDGLLVQALHVSPGDLLERGLDVHLDKVADQLAIAIADLPIRRDRGAHGDHAVPHQQVGDEADPQDVGVAILLGECQALGQVRSHHVAVQELDPVASLAERRHEQLGDGGLAGPGQPGEPDAEPSVLGHRKLLPTAPSGASMS